MEPTTLRLPLAPAQTWPHQQVHLIGVCGAGMRALAELLTSLGWTVSGSDQQPPTPAIHHLIRRGLTFHHGHGGDHVPAGADLIVFSPAIAPENPERQTATERGIPQFSYTQMLARLMADRTGVCVAGTHGKSTTTAMTGCILSDAGWKPSVVIGAELCESGQSAWAGSGEHFVVESCEFQRNFLEFRPRFASILSVEPDHFDCFADAAAMQSAFREFSQQVQPDGVLLARGDCPATMQVVQQAAAPVVTFGWSPTADWWADDIRRTSSGVRFRVYRQSQYFSELFLQVPGRHNVLNALAAAALCHEMGVGARDIRESLQEFRGLRRRFETVGLWRGVTIVDDYAHHPTAVASTLQTARELFGQRRIWCAFQPHQVSRTLALMDEFAAGFPQADEVLIAPVFAAREQPGDRSSAASRELADRISARGQPARFCESLDRVIEALEDGLRPGDVLITMGAGNIDRVHHAFVRRISRHSAARRAFGSLHLAETGRTRTVLPHTA